MHPGDHLHTIREIYKGVYHVFLDFPSIKFLKYVLKDEYPFVWIDNYYPGFPDNDWNRLSLPVFKNMENKDVLARNVSFDLVLLTTEFKEKINLWENGGTFFQIKKLPPDYLDMKRIEGKTRYDLLKKECDYLFEIKIAEPLDYGEIVSNDKKFLEELLSNPEINWDDLP